MNAIHRYRVPLLAMIASLGASLAACNKPSDQEAPATTGTASIPLASAADHKGRAIGTDAGGIATRYTPHFRGGTLMRIEELRTADEARGAYTFQGARLVRYEGAPVGTAGALLLEFDLQGQTLTARNGDEPATQEEISAIRSRAQLLRNHALAQHASRTHTTR